MAQLGTSARALFESYYTEDRMLSGYRQLYFDLLKMKYPVEETAVEPGPLAGSQSSVNHGYSGLDRPPREPKGSGLWHEHTR
jgi:hypothetical protein